MNKLKNLEGLLENREEILYFFMSLYDRIYLEGRVKKHV